MFNRDVSGVKNCGRKYEMLHIVFIMVKARDRDWSVQTKDCPDFLGFLKGNQDSGDHHICG